MSPSEFEWELKRTTKTYIEPREVEELERAATNLRDKLLIRFLFRLGCRVSEALGMQLEDIDLEKGRVTIVHLKSSTRLSCRNCGARLGKRHEFCPMCGEKVLGARSEEHERRRIRTLPVEHDTLEMLGDYIRRGGPVLKSGKRLIFGINRHRAWQIVKHCAEKAGLPRLTNLETGKTHNVSPHRLRDAFAVYAVKVDDSGDGLRLLQEHLGHQSFNTTAKYRKVSGKEHQEWYERLWGKNNP